MKSINKNIEYEFNNIKADTLDLDKYRKYKSIIINNCEFSKVINFPKKLEALQFIDSKIKKIEGLKDLNELYFRGTSILEIDNQKDLKNLKKLNIKDSYIPFDNVIFSKGFKKLEILYLSGLNISNIPNIPKNVKYLYITNTNISKIEHDVLPKNLNILELIDSKVSKIENIPNNLNMLILINCNVSKIEHGVLPKNLNTLELRNCKVSKIENLPYNLKKLYIDKDNTYTFNYNCKNLKIKNYVNKNISNFIGVKKNRKCYTSS